MDKTIKKREVIKDIKKRGKKIGIGAIREVGIKTREIAQEESGGRQRHRHGAEYAQDKVELNSARSAQIGEQKARHATLRAGEISKAKWRRETVRKAEGKRQVVHSASRQALQKKEIRKASATRTARNRRKTAFKFAPKSFVKGRKATRATKVVTRTSLTGVAQVQNVAKANMLAMRGGIRATHTGAKVSRVGLRAAIRAAAMFAKAAIAAVKSIVAALVAGGWVAVVVVAVVCVIGLLLTSAFGIFFTGEDMGDGNPSLREIIADINLEHQTKIDEIRLANPHDELMMTGSRANWQEVLAVFVVRTTTDADNPLDVITMDSKRQKMLKSVYWDMNTIEYRVENREHLEIDTETLEDGTVVETTKTTTRTTLHITQSAKTAKEVAEVYKFNTHQRELLAELLTPQFAVSWQYVLYGSDVGSGDIVEVAVSQLGNVGGRPYWSWYGFSHRVEWCATFVSWCANEVGYIEAGLVPKFSLCQAGVRWFRDAGRFQDARSGYVPKPGDIIFFDWNVDGWSEHVGIVERVEGGRVYTVEGNSGDAVRRVSYDLNSIVIVGYGLIVE